MKSLVLISALVFGSIAMAAVPASKCEIGYGKSVNNGAGDDLAFAKLEAGTKEVSVKLKGYTITVNQEEVCAVNGLSSNGFSFGELPPCSDPLFLNIQVKKGALDIYTQMDIIGGFVTLAWGSESIQVRCE